MKTSKITASSMNQAEQENTKTITTIIDFFFSFNFKLSGTNQINMMTIHLGADF